ncbi:MAG: class I SAM-dependent methyltransferase [Candidatus Methanoperedens sp.]|nr:class I SAM-dependent methyltransferase [Candidatus Methanoperedens sp.]
MYIDTYTSRCKIFRQIPDGSKVLEIGCADGRLANILTIKKKCRVYCVEKDHAMAVIGRKKCEEMLNIDIENTELPWEAGAFDCIVLGNVLEHMREPAKILADLKRYLSGSGFLIYSVPSIVNWHSRLTILSGKFEYAESGVFDKTHLRFYNLNSAKKLAQDAGYRIVWLDVTPSIYFYKERLNPLWYRLAAMWKNLFADEFIILARKG